MTNAAPEEEARRRRIILAERTPTKWAHTATQMVRHLRDYVGPLLETTTGPKVEAVAEAIDRLEVELVRLEESLS